MDNIFLLCILTACCCYGMVDGYISGAPLQSCATMIPGHGVTAQTGSSPYTITTSSSTYRCKQDLTVTLSGTDTFKGFQCQMRTDVDTYQTHGTLAGTGDIPIVNYCGSNIAAITHTNANLKSSVTFTWKPYITNETSIYAICTIVKQEVTFWVKQQSAAITFEEGGDCTPDDDDDDDTDGAINHRASPIFSLLIGCLICIIIRIC